MKLEKLIPRFCTSLSMGLKEPELKQYGNAEEEADTKDVEEVELKELVIGYT